MIMVDEIRLFAGAPAPFDKGSCHLTTDGLETELRLFAHRIGLRADWLQRSASGVVHFDLTSGMREGAISAGAVFVSARKQAVLRIAKRRVPLPAKVAS